MEFKHQNISAVLSENGLPYIDGYKPAKNYQNILSEVVEQYLGRDSTLLSQVLLSGESESVQGVDLSVLDFSSCEEKPPEPRGANEQQAKRGHTYRGNKLDYAKREAANRRLGALGEEFVVAFEKRRLTLAGKKELARRVCCVATTIGDGLGYDVASFETDGSERYIEVKTTKYGKEIPFVVTANELSFSQDYSDRYFLYRVFNFTKSPKFFKLQGSLPAHCKLDPQVFIASI